MRRGTTPTVKIRLANINLGLLDTVVITFKQGSSILNKAGQIEDGCITVELTQEETLQFGTGTISIQMKGKLRDGKIVASGIKQSRMDDILNEEPL